MLLCRIDPTPSSIFSSSLDFPSNLYTSLFTGKKYKSEIEMNSVNPPIYENIYQYISISVANSSER